MTRSLEDFAPRRAVGHAGRLALQRGADLVRVLAFAALVPRLVGPAVFGQYSLVMAVATWFALVSGFGATQVMSVFVPRHLRAADPEAAERLLGGFVVLRTASGTLAALTFFVSAALWLRDIDAPALGLAAAGIALRTVANVLFAFRLGRGDAAGWGTGEISRQWLVLLLIVPGALLFGIRGALGAVFLSELLLVGAGVATTRAHLHARWLRFDRAVMTPYLRFNLYFLAGNVVYAACQRGGEPLLRAAGGRYDEIGVFAAAYAVYQFASQGCRHVSTGMGPFFQALRQEARLEELAAWAARLVAALAGLGAVAALCGAALGGHVVPLVLGPGYAGAFPVLVPLLIALPAVAISAVSRVLAVTFDRPGATFAAAVAQAGTLAVGGAWLIPRQGASGAALVILAASVVHALVLTVGLGRAFRLPLRPWATVTAPGLLLGAPFLFMDAAWRFELAAFAAALLLYAAFLFRAGVLSRGALSMLDDPLVSD